MYVCEECGQPLECTVEVYCDVTPQGLIVRDVNLEEAHWYCSEDHEVSEDRAQELFDHFETLSAFGRAPGSGALDILLATPRDA